MADSRIRGEAQHLVAEWAGRLVRLEAVGSVRHPLLRLRDQALATNGAKGGVVFGAEQTAHGVATMGSRAPRAIGGRELETYEIDRIMIAVDQLGIHLRRALYLVDGLGVSERDAAQLLHVGRARLREWRAEGLGAVQMALLAGTFRA